ncbi:MAG TPA: bifunctional glutamate N-acetyltransferase/amino-acid acetyltransferase ArgJ [Acidimicrobiales bacterium]|nr:bifunctional glutamate N-acetyltransferase/amino-acid acetyltransferase ArgJ [Acidimicrobiales bacterium]
MSVTEPRGFVAAGMACGIKASGAPDLALVATVDGDAVAAAGVFTSNLAAAAPVQVSRAHLAATGGRAAGVIVSSGNANAATGDRGKADAERMCALVGEGLGVSATGVLICQTGLIGIPLPMTPIEAGIPALVAARSAGRPAAEQAATAIMTTDLVRKEVVVDGGGFIVGGMAKGAAMLAPHMATMLAVLTTDAAVEPAALKKALVHAVDGTFNRLTIDGCTSTNDTVLVLASGRAGTPARTGALADALAEACAALAGAMAADAEGASRVVHIIVTGAVSDDAAHTAARKVADSNLVKCSINGEDPYWGRVISELGSAGIAFDMDRVEIAYGDTVVCRGGVAADHDDKAVRAHMAERNVELHCDLGLGQGRAAVLSADLGHGYIDENRTTS